MNVSQATATFHCRVCHAAAATVTLLPAAQSRLTPGNDIAGALCVLGFMGYEEFAVGPAQVAAATRALHTPDVQTLYELDMLWAPFYCPTCQAVYCYGHWRVEAQFDADFHGWYDCSYGVCPQGHRRLLDE